jgi:two-component system LytT family sensor kinase
VIITLTIWLVILIPVWGMLSYQFFNAFGTMYIVGLPFCFIVYFINLYALIPNYKTTQKLTLFTYIIVLLLVVLVAGYLEVLFLMGFVYKFSFMGYLVYAWMIPSILTIGLSWWVYMANREKYRQLSTLKTALGASDANLQFLRSQINPHFLFNVLNTLYGTALKEKAEKTAKGIQKLGDMMRFMLHENMQPRYYTPRRWNTCTIISTCKTCALPCRIISRSKQISPDKYNALQHCTNAAYSLY